MDLFKRKNALGERQKSRCLAILDEMSLEYPELNISVGGVEAPMLDKIRAYYELKMMRSQKLYNKLLIFFAGLTAILTALNIYLTFSKV